MENNETKLKDLKDEFIRAIVHRFINWTESNDEEANLETLARFLIGSSIITDKQIVRFMTVWCYPKVLHKESGRKMRALYSMTDIIPRQKTQINDILKHYSKHFRYNKNLLNETKKEL